MTSAPTATPPAPSDSTAPQIAVHALQLWVGDLGQTRNLLTGTFGFTPADIPGTEGGPAVGLVSGEVRLILRQGATADSPISRHVARHGDTVADVTLLCGDPAAVADRARAHGFTVTGPVDAPTIDLFGDRTVCHTLRPTAPAVPAAPAGDAHLRSDDHIGYCLPHGAADTAARAYENVFGMRRLAADSFDAIGDQATGMRSIVLRSAGGFTVVLTEPISPTSTGQTQQFVDTHAGPGDQHAALACDDLFTTVEALRRSGVEFLPIPDRYYDQAPQRLPDLPVPWQALRRQRILVDADHDGLLYQLFTRPIGDRRTFFFELIQRAGATGFGVNNVTALFAAVQATISEDV
jgi:4-hydroxymandelate synthase